MWILTTTVILLYFDIPTAPSGESGGRHSFPVRRKEKKNHKLDYHNPNFSIQSLNFLTFLNIFQ
jgi:hypothetical protein